VGRGPRNNRLDCGGEPVRDPDPGPAPGFLNLDRDPNTEIVKGFLPRDARSASAVLLSYVVRPSVRPSLRLSVRDVDIYRGHKGWTSSKLITEIISLGSSLLGATTPAI